MRKRFIWSCLLMISLLGWCLQQSPYVADLDFIYSQIKENHPGMYNVADPTFEAVLEQTYSQARKSIAKTTDPTRHKQSLEHFVSSFNDTHLRIRWEQFTQSAIDSGASTELFCMKTISDGVAWVRVPTFFNLTDDQKESLERLTEELPTLQRKSAIVFDVRGNSGGNSGYAQQIIEALFGRDYVEQQLSIARQNTYIDWRASRDNQVHVQSLHERFGYSCFKEAADGMLQSIECGQPCYRQPASSEKPSAEFVATLSHSVSARIFVIIDHANVSSALCFIDYLKMMGHPIVLVGKMTKADRLYTEVRMLDLPSSTGSLIFPIKVIHGRIRGDNEPYRPDYEHDVNNTAELQRFIQELVARQ